MHPVVCGMARYIEPDATQNQIVMLNFAELYPPEHRLSRFLRLVQSLDLNAFDAGYENDGKSGGRPAIPVDRMLAVILYSLLYGNISMRRLEADLGQRADLMYLAGGLRFDHSTVGVFRRRHERALQELFTQTVFLGVEGGLIDFDAVCIDSTKIEASANRRDIGTREELERLYHHTEKICARRFAQWLASSDEDDATILKERHEEAQARLKRIERGRAFLAEHPDRKRVHLTDSDADWQKKTADS